MNIARPAASLSAGLLARKGEARPALRPQLHQVDAAPAEPDDLPAMPEIVRQRAELAVAYAPKPQAEGGAKGRAAFTLRLDPERHLRLRLAVAHQNRSAQLIVTEAVDRLLDDALPPALVKAAHAPA